MSFRSGNEPSAAAVFLLAIVAQVIVYDLVLRLYGPGPTISEQLYRWSLAHGWLPSAYYVGAALLGLHFFGLWWKR